MYSSIKSVQILLALLKQFEIQDIVLSPGGSDIPIIRSMESDKWFQLHSVVDERSAAYYAMGVAQMKNKPVACVCTSGTAVCNYLPGITEAYYQNVPVLVISADKNPYYQNQLETQKINQTEIFNGVVKKSVNLPLVNNGDDEWLCNRLINEALLELHHHGTGPVHINIPLKGCLTSFECEKLPVERKMKFVNIFDEKNWRTYAEYLERKKKILVVVGQNLCFENKDMECLNKFFAKFNCIFSIEHLSNVEIDGAINTYPLTEAGNIFSFKELVPDLIISIGNNLSAYNLKPFLRINSSKSDNWLIHEDGVVRDAYCCLTNIFECNPIIFFEKMLKYASSNISNDMHYYSEWKSAVGKINIPEPVFSNFYVAGKLAETIPQDSILHTAILNSTRVMQYFPLAKGVKSYSNVGALGIDGCFSSFVGQSAVTDELTYLLIGDLSFFYDMNAAGIRGIRPNMRIILLNNGGGAEFQVMVGGIMNNINTYICANHKKSAKGWIESLGYEYYNAKSKSEFDNIIGKFANKSEKPLFLEVFTEMSEDGNQTREFYDLNKHCVNSQETSSIIKEKVKEIVGQKNIEKAKKIISVIKE